MSDPHRPRADGWATHRRAQLEGVLAATTPQERLAWLEEAIRFAFAAGTLPRREPVVAIESARSLDEDP